MARGTVELYTMLRGPLYTPVRLALAAAIGALPVTAFSVLAITTPALSAALAVAHLSVLVALAVVRARMAAWRNTQLQYDERGIACRDRFWPRESLSALLVSRLSGLVDLELTTNLPNRQQERLSIRCTTHADGARWMKEFGLAPLDRTATIGAYVYFPWLGYALVVLRVLSILATPLLLSAAMPSLAVLSAACALLTFVAPSLLRRGWITIGADGVSFDSVLLKRFVPWSEVAEIEGASDSVVIELDPRDGERPRKLHLRARHGLRIDSDDNHDLNGALYHRLEAAFAAHESADQARSHVRDLVARSGRSTENWATALVELTRTTFRDLAVAPEDLESVLEDPSAAAEVRVGAAVALNRMRPDADRLRVLAKGVASPAVYEALEQLADGEEEAEVLAELRASDAR
ncbi:MAG: hypothetical protein U0271_43630 [Polyangiaceae bacterium]